MYVRPGTRPRIAALGNDISLLYLVALFEFDAVLFQVGQQGEFAIAMRNEDHIAARRIVNRPAGRIVLVAVLNVNHCTFSRRQQRLTEAVIVGVVVTLSLERPPVL